MPFVLRTVLKALNQPSCKVVVRLQEDILEFIWEVLTTLVLPQLNYNNDRVISKPRVAFGNVDFRVTLCMQSCTFLIWIVWTHAHIQSRPCGGPSGPLRSCSSPRAWLALFCA